MRLGPIAASFRLLRLSCRTLRRFGLGHLGLEDKIEVARKILRGWHAILLWITQADIDCRERLAFEHALVLQAPHVNRDELRLECAALQRQVVGRAAEVEAREPY